MKKIIALLLLVASLFALTSCFGLATGPMSLGKKLDDIYGDDASIYIFLSHEDIKYFFEDLEISDNGVYAIMEIDTYGDAYGDEEGYIFYCENSSQAKKIENEFIDYIKDNDLDDEGFTVSRTHTAVFIGSEAILRKIKS